MLNVSGARTPFIEQAEEDKTELPNDLAEHEK